MESRDEETTLIFGLTFTVIGSLSLVPDSLIIHFIEKIGLGELFKSEARKKVFAGFLGFPPESLVTNMKNLVANFVSESSEDSYSTALTFIMRNLNCCGAINGSDFSNSSKFQRSQNGKQLTYPALCCQSDTSKTGEQKCNSTVDTFHIGCAKKIHEKYLRLTDIFAYLTIVVYFVNIITIAMGVMVLSIPPHQKPKKLSEEYQ
ncbi:unnamed protein product [Trichobilharzia szidati]|nr:unnamed protein product [Trichobilharzia szidati]